MRIGVLSDLHCELKPARQRRWINSYEPAEVAERLERALAIFAGEEVHLVLLLGDTAELGDRAAFEFIFSRLDGSSSVPVAAVPGNHDGGDDLGAISASAAAHGVRVLNGASLVVRDMAMTGVAIAPVERGLRIFRGTLPAVPREGAVTLIASHFPLRSHERLLAAAGLPYSGDLANRDEIESLLQQAEIPAVVLSGHVHARCSDAAGRLLQLTVGALIEPPFDCTIVDVEHARGIAVRRRAFPLGDAAPINPVFAPLDERWAWSGDRWRAI